MSVKPDSILENDIFDMDDEDTQANKFLCFMLKEESYCISIRDVIEIVEMQKISEVPDMPDYVKGVINLRGKIIPVIDLRLLFKMEERIHDDRTCIVIGEIKDTEVGFIVDTVEEVVEIPSENIEETPSFKTSEISRGFIAGIGRVQNNVKIILNIGKLVEAGDLELMS